MVMSSLRLRRRSEPTNSCKTATSMQKNANRQTSGKASQALSAKAPQEVHGTDVFRRALQKAITRQTYEQARQALAPRPYAETNLSLIHI